MNDLLEKVRQSATNRAKLERKAFCIWRSLDGSGSQYTSQPESWPDLSGWAKVETIFPPIREAKP